MGDDELAVDEFLYPIRPLEQIAMGGLRLSEDQVWRVTHDPSPVLQPKALSKRSTKDIADELIKRHPELEPIKDQLIESDDY